MPDVYDIAPPLVRDMDPAEQAEAEERALPPPGVFMPRDDKCEADNDDHAG